jgi:hypothetical protein
MAAKHDQYHIIDSLANSNADILAYDINWNTAKGVSSHTLILVSTLVKIQKKVVREAIYKRLTTT